MNADKRCCVMLSVFIGVHRRLNRFSYLCASLCVLRASAVKGLPPSAALSGERLSQTSTIIEAFFGHPRAARVQDFRPRVDMRARNACANACEIVAAARQRAGGRRPGDTAAVGGPVWGGGSFRGHLR